MIEARTAESISKHGDAYSLSLELVRAVLANKSCPPTKFINEPGEDRWAA